MKKEIFTWLAILAMAAIWIGAFIVAGWIIPLCTAVGAVTIWIIDEKLIKIK